MPEFTFESLQKRVCWAVSDRTIDLEAWFMWDALTFITAAGYTHLTPKEVFEHLKEGIVPQQPSMKQTTKEVLQLVKELEAENEDTYDPNIVTGRSYID